MLRHYAVLRLLLAGFFLYFAWPLIPLATSNIEKVFWGVWLGLLCLVVGGNLAAVLKIDRAPALVQEQKRIRDTHKH